VQQPNQALNLALKSGMPSFFRCPNSQTPTLLLWPERIRNWAVTIEAQTIETEEEEEEVAEQIRSSGEESEQDDEE
jgi:hypothetical protein